jgi:hypothetical protein
MLALIHCIDEVNVFHRHGGFIAEENVCFTVARGHTYRATRDMTRDLSFRGLKRTVSFRTIKEY